MAQEKLGTLNSTLRYTRVNGTWLRGLPFNDDLWLSVRHERLNTLVNITIDTIFIKFEYKFLMGYNVKCFAGILYY